MTINLKVEDNFIVLKPQVNAEVGAFAEQIKLGISDALEAAAILAADAVREQTQALLSLAPISEYAETFTAASDSGFTANLSAGDTVYFYSDDGLNGNGRVSIRVWDGSAYGEPNFFDTFTNLARTAANAQTLASLPEGTVVSMGGIEYIVRAAATGTASVTQDLSVNGLAAYGLIYNAHYGAVTDGVVDNKDVFERAVKASLEYSIPYHIRAGEHVYIDSDPTVTKAGDLNIVNDGIFEMSSNTSNAFRLSPTRRNLVLTTDFLRGDTVMNVTDTSDFKIGQLIDTYDQSITVETALNTYAGQLFTVVGFDPIANTVTVDRPCHWNYLIASASLVVTRMDKQTVTLSGSGEYHMENPNHACMRFFGAFVDISTPTIRQLGTVKSRMFALDACTGKIRGAKQYGGKALMITNRSFRAEAWYSEIYDATTLIDPGVCAERSLVDTVYASGCSSIVASHGAISPTYRNGIEVNASGPMGARSLNVTVENWYMQTNNTNSSSLFGNFAPIAEYSELNEQNIHNLTNVTIVNNANYQIGNVLSIRGGAKVNMTNCTIPQLQFGGRVLNALDCTFGQVRTSPDGSALENVEEIVLTGGLLDSSLSNGGSDPLYLNNNSMVRLFCSGVTFDGDATPVRDEKVVSGGVRIFHGCKFKTPGTHIAQSQHDSHAYRVSMCEHVSSINISNMPDVAGSNNINITA